MHPPQIVALASLLLAACARAPEPRVDARAPLPQRIVALSVGAVDTLALLGQLERVVGVEEDCFVPGTERIAKIRNDDHSGPSKALNVEAVLALRPDLIIAKEDLRPALGERGISVLWLPIASDPDAIARIVESIGERLGLAGEARSAVQQMRAKEQAIAARVAPLPKLRVYFEAGRAGRSAGRGSVIDAMIRLAGGLNIAADAALVNPLLSSEAIVAADPEVIVLSPWSDAPEEVMRRPGWDRIAAVKARRVHRIPERDRSVQYPSPSCVDGCAALLVPWLHPGLQGARLPETR